MLAENLGFVTLAKEFRQIRLKRATYQKKEIIAVSSDVDSPLTKKKYLSLLFAYNKEGNHFFHFINFVMQSVRSGGNVNVMTMAPPPGRSWAVPNEALARAQGTPAGYQVEYTQQDNGRDVPTQCVQGIVMQSFPSPNVQQGTLGQRPAGSRNPTPVGMQTVRSGGNVNVMTMAPPPGRSWAVSNEELARGPRVGYDAAS